MDSSIREVSIRDNGVLDVLFNGYKITVEASYRFKNQLTGLCGDLNNNKLADETEPVKINIKGFAVGNGYCDWQLDFNANVENGRYHALTSQSAMDEAQAACQGNYSRCFWPRDDVECPEACGEAVMKATRYFSRGVVSKSLTIWFRLRTTGNLRRRLCRGIASTSQSATPPSTKYLFRA